MARCGGGHPKSRQTSRPTSRHEEEMDGPEVARLMRRFWPRDLNFFGGLRRESLLNGTGTKCSSSSIAASSATGSRTSLNKRSTVLDLRNSPGAAGKSSCMLQRLPYVLLLAYQGAMCRKN